MICYMPYTHIPEPLLKTLTGALGTITAYCSADALVPAHMRRWQAQSQLEIIHPAGVDQDCLLSNLREYKAWADIHQGDIGEMVGFFKFRQGRLAMVEDTNPTQISHQIRHYDDPPDQDLVDPLLQSALFLTLAQEFDAHHDAMDREMGVVSAMETRMVQRLSGEAPEEGVEQLMAQTMATTPSRDQIAGPYMIPRRVQAWCRLALEEASLPRLYLTASRAVVDHIQEVLGEGAVIYHGPLSSGRNMPGQSPPMRELIQSLVMDPDPQPFDADAVADTSSPRGSQQLTICRLAGVSPQSFLTTLGVGDLRDEAAQPREQGPENTLIGLVSAG